MKKKKIQIPQSLTLKNKTESLIELIEQSSKLDLSKK